MQYVSHRMIGATLAPLFLLPINTDSYNISEALGVIFYNHNLFVEQITDLSLGVGKLGFAFILFFASVLIGSTFPDIDFKFKAFYPPEKRSMIYLYHRQITHSVLLWLVLWLYMSSFILGYNIFLSSIYMGFVIGAISHIIADAFTGSVPWLLYGPYNRPATRIGITTFLPKVFSEFFTKKLPVYSDRYVFLYIPLLLFTFYKFYSFHFN